MLVLEETNSYNQTHWSSVNDSFFYAVIVFFRSHMWNHTVFAFLWLISLSVMSSRSIHVVANCRIPFYFYGWFIHMCVCILSEHFYPSIHQWTLRLFPCLGYCTWCSMNMGTQVSLQHSVFISSAHIPSSRIARSYNSSSNSLRNLDCFLQWL